MGSGTTQLSRSTNALNDAGVDENGYQRISSRRKLRTPNGNLPSYLWTDEPHSRYSCRSSQPQVDDSRQPLCVVGGNLWYGIRHYF